MGKSTISMAIFNSYVELAEGISCHIISDSCRAWPDTLSAHSKGMPPAVQLGALWASSSRARLIFPRKMGYGWLWGRTYHRLPYGKMAIF